MVMVKGGLVSLVAGGIFRVAMSLVLISLVLGLKKKKLGSCCWKTADPAGGPLFKHTYY